MSIERYIEVDSLYRDRQQWPNPAQFQVGFRHAGIQSPITAKDPVSDQSPIYSWNSSFREDQASLTVPISGVDNTATVSGTSTLIIEAPLNNLRRVRDYYNNAVINLTDGVSTVRLRILDYQFIEQLDSVDKAEVTVSPGLSSGFGPITGTSIENPTNETNTAVVPQIFIPNAPDAFNSFVGMEIENVTTGESRTIIEFDARTHMATLDANTSTTWDTPNDNFVIREDSQCGRSNLLAISSTGSVVQLPSTTTGDQGGNFLRAIEPVPNVTSGFSTRLAPYGQEVRIYRYVTLDGTFSAFGGLGTNTFTLSTGEETNNYYNGMFITNVNTGETREIASYDGTTKVGTVTTNWGSGAVGNTFAIRTAFIVPFTAGNITNIGTFVARGGIGTNSFQLDGNAVAIDNYYVGATITDLVTGEVRTIDTYAGGTQIGTVTANWTVAGGTNAYKIEDIAITSKPIALNGAFVARGGPGTNTFQLSADASSVDNYYVGATITDTITGDVQVVASYNGTTKTGTIVALWAAGPPPFSPTDSYTITQYTAVEIECFTRDNCQPMSYSGSMVSSQGQCCYQISLLNLILPNGTLDTGTGGRVAFFPFVYVELQNVTATGAGLQNVIYSNNPHARRMLFRCIVSDTQNPLFVPFAKFGGSGMRQTIKFKPNDVLKFGVYLPNGEPFKLFEDDTSSPTPPNPLVQVTAMFSIRKMS